jgi:hypothetical protein
MMGSDKSHILPKMEVKASYSGYSRLQWNPYLWGYSNTIFLFCEPFMGRTEA